MILNDKQIRRRCEDPGLWFNGRPLISPFREGKVEGCISYGLTSSGYDLALDGKVMAFKNTRGGVVDPKAFNDPTYRASVFDCFESYDSIVVPANGYILVQCVEYLSLPRDLKGHCIGKSTYARCGVIVNTTPLEPEWHGHLTIEISNSNPAPVKLYVGEGIAQLEFHLIDPPERSYADKGGKYQGQRDVTPPMIKPS